MFSLLVTVEVEAKFGDYNNVLVHVHQGRNVRPPQNSYIQVELIES